MKIYFKGLSEIRALAALCVLIHHLELFKEREQVSGLYQTSLRALISGLGKNGVYVFFVLSGFLITYLLMSEVKISDRITVGKFYIRRILRIWPLYYLVVLFSFFALPMIAKEYPSFFGNSYYFEIITSLQDYFGLKLILFLLFLPNLALAMSFRVAGASQAWSVGVEEQFYLLWPVIINRFKNKIFHALVGVGVMKFLLLFLFFLLQHYYPVFYFGIMYRFLLDFKIELMVIGGLGAYFLYKGYGKGIRPSFNRNASLVLILFIVGGFTLGINYIFTGIFTCIFIFLNALREKPLLENRFLSYLGDISYGIYMYHPACIYLAFCICRFFYKVDASWTFNLLYYGVAILLTLAISMLSFRFLERPILSLKHRFTVVNSGK